MFFCSKSTSPLQIHAIPSSTETAATPNVDGYPKYVGPGQNGPGNLRKFRRSVIRRSEWADRELSRNCKTRSNLQRGV